MIDLSILLKPEKEQEYIAQTSTNPKILDILSNSESKLVKLTVLSNPAVSSDTVKRKVDDEEKVIWEKAYQILHQREN